MKSTLGKLILPELGLCYLDVFVYLFIYAVVLT